MPAVDSPPVAGSTAPATTHPVGEQTTRLVADIAEDAGTLLTQHANLLHAEMREGLKAARWWALAAACGLVALLLGALFTAIAAVHGLQRATGWDEWACWLTVGGSLLVIGCVLAAIGAKYLVGMSLIPNRTIKSLSETWSWLVKRSK